MINIEEKIPVRNVFKKGIVNKLQQKLHMGLEK
jgi:hypothetical protein